MMLSIVYTLLASLVIAFTSDRNILDDVDTKDVKKDVIDDLNKGLDDCDKDQKNKDDFLDCVDDVLNDFDTDEVKRSIKRAIRREARQVDKKDDKKDDKSRKG